MTIEQNASLMYSLYQSKNNDLEKLTDSLMAQFAISKASIELAKQNILEEFNQGVHHLNPNQFDNLIKMAKEKNFDESEIVNKLNFYEIEKECQKNIIRFLEGYNRSQTPMHVYKMDSEFKGVQVATNDDFNEILRVGYTGDWVIDPKNVKPLRIQIASMNESGSFSRGYYINANIERMEPIDYEGKTRYRIYLEDPVVVNSGNRNIKFSNNPVRYIK